jgi:phospholipid/cholesterol/gamma-HCH transport system permease protein
VRWFFRKPVEMRELLWQMYFVGVQSIPVVLATGAFTGMVLAYSFYLQFITLGVETLTGPLPAKALVWQLGPVLTGLMLAGRAGCAMAAELGTMVVTEQVDALKTMGADPTHNLVLPRVLAFTLMTPVLTTFSMVAGIAAGLLLIIWGLHAEAHYLWSQIDAMMVPYDYVQGLTKGLFFGLIVGLISCRRGLDTTGGAEGVGKATTESNVSSCISVLVFNFVLTLILAFFNPNA